MTQPGRARPIANRTMTGAVDQALAATLRALPNVRGKTTIVLRWKVLRQRRRPLDGGWELRVSDGSILTIARGSTMTWMVAAMSHWDRHLQEFVSQWPCRVSFVKLDVEGFELEVLRGAHNTIARDRPVIFGEINAAWLTIRGEDLVAYLDTVASLGYEVYAVDERRSAVWRPKDTPSLRRLETPLPSSAQNLLLVPASVRSS
jgi:hypothetical protein